MPFSQIIGQPGAVSLLQRFLDSGHLPHALLFVGPEGVGKHLTARALAQALLCERSQGEAAAAPSLFGDAPAAVPQNDACGECPSCRRIQEGHHPDVHEVGGTGARGLIQVETVRELLRALQLSSVEGGFKVAILDPAERMNREASNTLLKTLEEPPAQTVLVLVARERSLLLPTIVSRCQAVRFGLLDRDALRQYFQAHSDAQSAKTGPAGTRALETIVALSGGSIGKAVALAGGELESSRAKVRQMIENLERAGGADLLAWAGDLSELSKEDGEEFAGALEGLTLFFRDVAASLAGVEPAALTSQDLLAEVERWAARLDLEGALLRLEAVLEVREALDHNAHKEMAALELARKAAPPGQGF